VRFYVSFACSWAFAEVKKMEGNAKIIKFIARDENLHLAATQTLLKILPKDDPDFIKIEEECRDAAIKLFEDAVEQEKKWAEYLFKDGSMIGLNYQLLSDYVEWIANKRMTAVGLPTRYKGGSNPLPWTQKWISGGEVQVAPQQTQITSYVNGGVKQDVDEKSFKGFSL
jgi:ribonucleoside-diphosphate reductase beta chain